MEVFTSDFLNTPVLKLILKSSVFILIGQSNIKFLQSNPINFTCPSFCKYTIFNKPLITHLAILVHLIRVERNLTDFEKLDLNNNNSKSSFESPIEVDLKRLFWTLGEGFDQREIYCHYVQVQIPQPEFFLLFAAPADPGSLMTSAFLLIYVHKLKSAPTMMWISLQT